MYVPQKSNNSVPHTQISLQIIYNFKKIENFCQLSSLFFTNRHRSMCKKRYQMVQIFQTRNGVKNDLKLSLMDVKLETFFSL